MHLGKVALPLAASVVLLGACRDQGKEREPAPARAAPAAGAAAPAPSPSAAQRVQMPSIAPLVDTVRPTVVSVEVTARAPASPLANVPDDLFERFFGAPGGPGVRPPPERYRQGLGSGFLISEDGWILTNHHVVQDATAIRVKLEDGRTFEAEVKGRDPLTDVALLKLKGEVEGLPAAPLGDSEELRIGDWVVAIGSPFGLSSSVSAGIISARARDIQMGPYDEFLQTDAAINPGNSGGPLFNMSGQVVGMNTAIVGGGTGIGFAVPSHLIKALLPQLREKGAVTRGYLGVYVQDLTPELAQALNVEAKEGAIVASVSEGSPAAKGGLEQDDVIVALNGEPIRSADALTRRVAQMQPGSEAKLDVLRGDSAKEVRVELGTRPDLEGVGSTGGQARQDTTQRFGLAVQNVPPQLAQQLGTSGGALIAQVRPGSPAANADLREGMVVVEAGEAKVESARDLIAALRKAKPGTSLLLRVRVPGSDVRLLRAITVP